MQKYKLMPLTVAEQAVQLAKSVPRRAIELAQGVLDGDVDSHERATALWAAGQAQHELGENVQALDSLRMAVEQTVDPLRSRIEVTTAAIESAVGMPSAAMDRLGRLAEHHEPGIAGLAKSQRGLIKLYGGDGTAALVDLEESLPLLEAAGTEQAALARVRSNVGFCLIVLGRYQAAVRDLGQAVIDAHDTGQDTVAAAARQNFGFAQAQLGNLPSALQSLEDARRQYQALGDPSRGLTGLYDDLAETYRLAGLTQDAVRYSRVGSWTARQGDNIERQAEAEYRRAVCLLEHGNRKAAADAAGRAAALFDRSGRRLWRQRAELIAVEASTLPDVATGLAPGLVERISNLAGDLVTRGHTNEPRSLVNRAVHRLIDEGRADEAQTLIDHHDIPLAETGGELASESVLDRLELQYRAALIAVLDQKPLERPLAEARWLVTEHNLTLGDQELRAGAARLTDRFRSLAVRSALGGGWDAVLGSAPDGGPSDETHDDANRKAMAVLLAEEEWRAISLTLPRAVAATDDETTQLLVELRQTNRIESNSIHPSSDPASGSGPGSDSVDSDSVDSRRAELEDQLRLRSMTANPNDSLQKPSSTAVGRQALDRSFIERTVSQLDGAVTVEWIEHHGQLIGVRIAPDGSMRLWPAGTVAAAERLARFVHQSLGDINATTDTDAARSSLADLFDDCADLQTCLWPDQPDPWLDGETGYGVRPMVLSPPSALMALPWRLIAGSPRAPADVTLTPSIAFWRRVELERSPDDSLFDTAAVVTGPGLLGVGADEAVVKRVLPHSDVVESGNANCERVKEILTSARFVHLACHGRFRPESPRFSSLTMADGPLTLFELDWLERVPDLVMLAACDSGKVSARPGGELLGTAPAMLAAGASTVIAPICPVRDHEVSEALVPFYEALAQGPSAAAQAMDLAFTGERPEVVATAASFQVVGASLRFGSGPRE